MFFVERRYTNEKTLKIPSVTLVYGMAFLQSFIINDFGNLVELLRRKIHKSDHFLRVFM